jgi:uncharacterized protein involved in tellurium resistance
VSADPTAPGRSPARADLAFLRRRTRPARVVTPEAVPSALDLAPVTAQAPPPRARSTRPVVRVPAGERRLLGTATPMVTLTRLQSGVGALVVEALCARAVGDLRMGCAYTLADGYSSTVQHSGGRNSGPHGSKSPVLLAGRREFERLTVDLRQNRRLRRLIVYGFSESRQVLRWGGALAVTTHGGTRLDLPVDQPAACGVTVFLALYNVDGEFVLRTEMTRVDGDVRDACQAYGFDRITWVDGRTPAS